MKATLLYCCAVLAMAQPVPVLDVQVSVQPALVTSAGRLHLAYEIYIKNLQADEVTVSRVEVVDADSGKVLTSLDRMDLAAHLKHLGGVKGTAPQLAGGGRLAVFLWVDLAQDAPPPSHLQHRVFAGEREVKGEVVTVAMNKPLILSAPFRDGDWVAANGPGSGEHARAIMRLNGKEHISQRFAIDWLRLGSHGSMAKGKGKENGDYYGYGTEVLAVADGTVSAIKDGIPENKPGKLAVPITGDTIAGNYVSIDVGSGRFAQYGHLEPSSLRVKPGDAVKKGQVIGLLGNSGNSDAPHLHFQVTDGASLLESEGMPYGIESFEVLGRAPEFKLIADPQPRLVRGELPMDGMVVRFQGRGVAGSGEGTWPQERLPDNKKGGPGWESQPTVRW